MREKLNAKNLYLASQSAVLAGAIFLAVITARADQWQPIQLSALLLVLTIAGDRLTVRLGAQNLSPSFVALALAMTLLGPIPAAVFGTLILILELLNAERRSPFEVWISNVATYVVFLLAGGLLTQLFVGDVHAHQNAHAVRSPSFAVVVAGVYITTNLLNFALIAIQQKMIRRKSIVFQVRRLLIPMLPAQLALATFTAVLAFAYSNVGYAMVAGLVIVIVIFQYLSSALARSEDRAQQLSLHANRLATLQLGVLTTLVETLALRDRMTARHAAAVARYGRALARELGCSEAEQDLIHTAGLLHDIGKFALPDRILHADVLSDDDWAVIRRHPQEGATLVGRLDGYGPVADAILYHHEHVDGSGYPAGLIGNEIPLASRIIAVCSAYDAMTSRDSYRSPMTPQDAFAELRRMSGRQFDGELVSRFIAMIEDEGSTLPAPGDEADFEAELAFERRARTLAQPVSG
jgi:putative nucleotidyltransferase with HDIG domain